MGTSTTLYSCLGTTSFSYSSPFYFQRVKVTLWLTQMSCWSSAIREKDLPVWYHWKFFVVWFCQLLMVFQIVAPYDLNIIVNFYLHYIKSFWKLKVKLWCIRHVIKIFQFHLRYIYISLWFVHLLSIHVINSFIFNAAQLILMLLVCSKK